MGSLLSGRAAKANQPTIPYPDTQLRIQTSVLGRVRPVGWGRVRMSGNIILATNFNPVLTATANVQNGGSGTKIPGTSLTASVSYSYTYYATVIMAFGQTQVTGIVNVWTSSSLVQFTGPGSTALNLSSINQIANPNGGGTGLLFHGDYAQTAWSYTGALSPSSLAYRGEAYLAFGPLNMGSSSSIPNYNFELDYALGFDLPTVCPDANPADVITDYLTNTDHGVPQFLSSYLADVSNLRLYCRAFSLLVSFVETNQRSASSMLTELARVLNVDFVWSSGLLKVVPYTPFGGGQNGYIWPAQTQPQYAFTDVHFLQNQGSLGSGASSISTPVAIIRQPRAQCINHTRLEYLPRGAYYNPWILDYVDEGAVQNWGVEIIGDVIQAHQFCFDAAAQSAVQILAAKNQIIRQFQFTVGRRFILLDPMDLITITDTTTGLVNQPALIDEIQENSDGTLTITASEYLALVGPPAYGFTTINATNSLLNLGGPPGNVNTPIIYEPPDQLGGGLAIWLAVSGQNPILWGGCTVYMSYDGADYVALGNIQSDSQMGVLTATLPSVTPAITGQTIDNTNTLSVNLTESDGSLLSGSAADFAALKTLCLVDNELVAYQNATLTGAFAYNLAPLSRGCYGSTIASHAIGASFTSLANIFSFNYSQDHIGQTIYFKFLSFNVFGGAQQQLSDVGAFTYTITGAALASPLPNVTNLRTVFVGAVTNLYWDEVSDFRPVQYLVKKGTSWNSAITVSQQAHPPFTCVGDDTYWVSAISQPTAALVVYSATPVSITIAGSQLTQNVQLWSDEDGIEQGGSYWPGTAVGCAPDAIGLRLTATGNILTDANVLTTPDINNYGGGLNASGTYTSLNTVDAGRVCQMLVQANWTAIGIAVGSNILDATKVPNILTDPDILGAANSRFINVYPQLRIGTGTPGSITWGSWQKYQAGVYNGRFLQMQLVLTTIDSGTIAYCTNFDWTVSLSARIDHYLNKTVPAGGLAITFTPDQLAGGPAQVAASFNGGPNAGNLPSILVTWQNNPGDTLLISNETLSGVTITILNGGVGVTTAGVNIVVEGY